MPLYVLPGLDLQITDTPPEAGAVGSFSVETLNKLYFALKLAHRGFEDPEVEEDLIDALVTVDEADLNAALLALIKIQQILTAVGTQCALGKVIDRKPIGEGSDTPNTQEERNPDAQDPT